MENGQAQRRVGRLRQYTTWLRPELESAPADPWSYVGQLKFDTHLHDPVALRFLVEKAGSGNVLIGTDCSFLSCTPSPMGELREALHRQVYRAAHHKRQQRLGLNELECQECTRKADTISRLT